MIEDLDSGYLELYETFSDQHLHEILKSNLSNASDNLMRVRICEYILCNRSGYGRNLRADDDEPKRR